MEELDILEQENSQSKAPAKITDDSVDYTLTREFSGKYITAVGKRKTATSQVRLYEKGRGIIVINGQALAAYLPILSHQAAVIQPLRVTGLQHSLDFSVLVTGGGKSGQAEAIAHGIARCLVKMNEAVKPVLKASGLMTRDARIKERKKPGLKRARRAPQWSKR
ncbi:MAG TPA: 30S ribosomal protein S9 [bacterium]|jgi:small subunit ribosomal protein S9|nr:30S ribosomal protein S9 [bacterium]HNZ51482.1 30S ribosomal protein S9 [bacterium]HOF79438.1 30S ribosomal protein S9 [bacterium]HOH85291.1 30S ribosomal protein S9 [bacterium]HOQ91898.1 30S ribosomal protein S9 [bacterium]